MRASGTSSCIRLRARRKVDLPQPLGPMMAVTARAAMSSETFLSTWLSPKKTERLRTVRAVGSPRRRFRARRRTLTVGRVGHAFSAHGRDQTLRLEPVARQEADADVDGQDEQEQDQRARPGLPVPVVVGRNGVVENLQRQRGDGVGQFVRPEAVAEGGEQQRRGFAGHARQREQDAGDDAFERGAHDDLHDGAPLGDAQRERGFAVAVRHELQDFLGRAHDERNHHQAEHDAAGQRGKAFHRHDQQRINDDAPGDGRHAVEDVGGETNPPVEPRRAVFGKEHAAEHADGHAEQRRPGPAK